MKIADVQGDIPFILRNDANLYEGNLKHYFRLLCKAKNVRRPYHNLRHMLHVTWLCYQASRFYRDTWTQRQMRNLLVAAIFHDFNHPGAQQGDDDLNIEKALRGLRQHITVEDRPYLAEIEAIIKATEYPYNVPTAELGIFEQVIREADSSQAFSVAWFQQVIVGLADEWEKTILDVIKMQRPFLSNLKFVTEWGKQMWPQDVINAKILESDGYREILEETDTEPVPV